MIGTEQHTDIAQACALLGFVGVEADFSGGNDEGGVDGVQGIKEDGERVVLEHAPYPCGHWDAAIDKYVYDERATESPEREAAYTIYAAMEAPVVDRWGSFAGDFYVSGTVTFDAATRVMKMSGEEEVKHDEPFSEEW